MERERRNAVAIAMAPLMVTSYNYQRQRGGFYGPLLAALGRASARALVPAASRALATQGTRAVATQGARALATQGTRALATQGARTLATRGTRALARRATRYVPRSGTVAARSGSRALANLGTRTLTTRGVASLARAAGRSTGRRGARLRRTLGTLGRAGRKVLKKTARKALPTLALTGAVYGIDSAIRYASGDKSMGLSKEDVKRIIAESALQATDDALNGKKVTAKLIDARVRKNALAAINASRPGGHKRKTIPLELLRGLRGGVEAELALKQQTFAIPHRLKRMRAFGTGRRAVGGGKRGRRGRKAVRRRKKKKAPARRRRRKGGRTGLKRKRKGGVRAMRVGPAKRRYMAARDVFDLA